MGVAFESVIATTVKRANGGILKKTQEKTVFASRTSHYQVTSYRLSSDATVSEYTFTLLERQKISEFIIF